LIKQYDIDKTLVSERDDNIQQTEYLEKENKKLRLLIQDITERLEILERA
jgi:hypothetical protein